MTADEEFGNPDLTSVEALRAHEDMMIDGRFGVVLEG